MSLSPHAAPALSDADFDFTRQQVTPTPEFPSMLLPAAMIIGFLGTVLLIQRTREQ
jgi:hypothetical protein